jgi:hypothetical protein
MKSRLQIETDKCISGDLSWLNIGRVDDSEAVVTIFKEKRLEFSLDE